MIKEGMSDSITIIGIDPGSRVAGYGLIRLDNGDLKHVAHGVFKLPLDGKFEARLLSLRNQLSELLARYQPQIGVVERIFLGKNADSAFKLGHARGICLGELAFAGTEVVEYATRQVKKGVTGNGGATKEQVGMLVAASLSIRLAQNLPEDATDALALAYYHGITMQVKTRLRGRIKERGVST